jgi:hypothetical protein
LKGGLGTGISAYLPKGVPWRRPQWYSATGYVALLPRWVRELYCHTSYTGGTTGQRDMGATWGHTPWQQWVWESEWQWFKWEWWGSRTNAEWHFWRPQYTEQIFLELEVICPRYCQLFYHRQDSEWKNSTLNYGGQRSEGSLKDAKLPASDIAVPMVQITQHKDILRSFDEQQSTIESNSNCVSQMILALRK